MPFVKGQSGNPNGRPSKSRALTAILATAGATKVPGIDGKPVPRKQILADLMWQAATAGEMVLPNGTKMLLSPEDTLAAAKWLYTHIDGPPKAEVGLTGANGGPIQIQQTTPGDVQAALERLQAWEAQQAADASD